ncbi:MAG: response regulator [Nitrospirota bacterium]|nr:response regulator [Nitrospirota bacterium]
MSRVLITDDSLLQRKTLSAIVADVGHEVDTACNGQEALEKIQANPPDCLLLDMLMPIMDGVQVLETLESRGVKLPIIVLTADVQDWLKDRCLQLGATIFLNKPVKQDQLQQALRNILPAQQPSEASCT